jgi:aminocarboxymuconate-semialdehyde decarboxylase
MQLITAGYLQRFPKVRIICSHLGGALPMIPLRADDHLAWEAQHCDAPLTHSVQTAHRFPL